MIITCPSCGRKYSLEDRLIKAPVQKMRCSLCGHVFVYEQGAAQEEEKDRETLTSRVESEYTGATVRKKRRLGLATVVVTVALLFIAAASAYFYWVNTIGAADKWLRIQNTEGRETAIKDGKIFLIKGLIVNGSTKARKYVILKGKLFDEHGTVIGEHFALAGLPLSVEEVRGMRAAEIDKKVADFRQSNLSAFVLRKGGQLPFSVVFPNTYTGTPKEFTVEVMESPLL